MTPCHFIEERVINQKLQLRHHMQPSSQAFPAELKKNMFTEIKNRHITGCLQIPHNQILASKCESALAIWGLQNL